MSVKNILTQSNKKYGTEIMSKGGSVVEMPRIPTGSLSLDLETGGGVPVGRITTFSGHYSDGKTSIVLKIVAEYQKRYPDKDVVWIDAEGAWDRHWSHTLGVDADSVYLVHPEYSQQAFDIAEQCITADVGLLVVDSVAALVPKEEAEATMEDWQVGLAARINGKFIRRTHSSLNDKRLNDVPPTVILINQLRQNVGPYGGETEPGGKAIGFAASVRIKIRKGDLYPKAKSNYDTSIVPKGQQVKFYVEKNKTAPPQTRGHVWFYFDTLDGLRTKGSYDRLEEIFRYAQKYDIITRRGKMYDLRDLDTGEVIQTTAGSLPMAKYLRESKDVRTKLEAQLMALVTESNVGPEPKVEQPQSGNNKAEGDKSSEGPESEESASQRSDTLGKGRHQVGDTPDPAQADDAWDEDAFDLSGSIGIPSLQRD